MILPVEPVVITPVQQLDDWDCGVVCLVMLLGTTYADIRRRIRYKVPIGLSVWEMKRIAKALGHPVTQSKVVSAEDIGIMILDRPTEATGEPWSGHYVMMLKGIIYNPAQGQLWTDPEAYVKTGGWTVNGILKRKD